MTSPADRIPWWEPKLGASVRDAVLGVIDSGYINDGNVTRQVEARVAAAAEVRHGVATTSCTAALAIALLAAGVRPGDEVLVPDLTFVATANAVRLAGAVPVLVDVDAVTMTMSPERAAAAIGPKTRAILPVDLNGRSADYAELAELCDAHGLALICDSAQALGSRAGGRGLGSFGVAGCFSFSANKLVFGGQGGAVVTDDDEIHLRLRELKDHGRRTPGTGGDDLHPVVGYNFKYPNVQAAVVLAQLEELDARLDHVRVRDGWYRELLDGCPGIRFPGRPGQAGEACLWADVLAPDRDRLTAALEAAGIGYRRFYLPVHRQEPYADSDNRFPNASALSDQGLWLPSALSLTRAQAERTAAIIRAALDG